MNRPFTPMDVIDNTHGSILLNGPARVLDFGWIDGVEVVWLIDLPRSREAKPNQQKPYLCQPYTRPLSELVEAWKNKQIFGGEIQSDPRLGMKDQDLLRDCKTDHHKQRLQKAFIDRDARYEALGVLILEKGSSVIKVPVATLLQDPTLPSRLADRAKTTSSALSTLYKWLHKYLAGGCQKNALLSNYLRVGNPGKPKAQARKLGRSPQLFIDGLVPCRGYPLTAEDKERLGWGYALIGHALSPRDAFLVTCSTFWSAKSLDERDRPTAKLFEKHLRPTFAQFMRWGEMLRGESVTRMLMGSTAWRQKAKAVGGSEQDRVAAVGQEAMFDGTTTDVYLTSCGSRLKKLPPMTRLILKDTRLGIVYGVYCGWLPPSPATALQTILHGAMPVELKAKWAQRFGVALNGDEIPSLLCRNHLADNGELKAQSMTEAEEQFGFGISFTLIGGGDCKGGVESEHQSMHVRLDKKLPGATHGKSRPRGQDHAATSALWNYYEYMSELIQYIVWHNSVQLVPHLAPDVMLLENPETKPTRMNIYRWLTARHMNVSLPVSFEKLRGFTLPDVEAVIRKNGVYLEQKVHGRRAILLKLRYSSQELVETGLMSAVKQTGIAMRVLLKMDRNDLSEAWLPTKAGMIRLELKGRDETLKKKLTLDEWVLHLEDMATQKLLDAGATEKGDAGIVLRRLGITELARQEAKGEAAKLGKPISKASLIRNLDKNRVEELELLRAHEAAQPTLTKNRTDSTAVDEPADSEAYSAIDEAMDQFLADSE